MTGLIITVFFVSLAGVIGLFILKILELRRPEPFAARVRAHADYYALVVKRFGTMFVQGIEHLPTTTVLVVQWLVHVLAVGIARVARAAEHGAHRVADMVSHRRTFERGTSRSPFLTQVRREDEDTNETPRL